MNPHNYIQKMFIIKRKYSSESIKTYNCKSCEEGFLAEWNDL